MSRRKLELTALALTGLSYWPACLVDLRAVYVVVAMVGWAAYVGGRAWQDRSALAEWGFRTDNLRRAMRGPTLLFLTAAAAMAAYAAWQGTLTLHWHLALLFLLYPLWGIVQQFLVQGLLATNLRELGLGPIGVTLIAATGFSVCHYPESWLMLATFGLGLVFTPMYMRRQNLLPLGVYHGWLGALFFFWVMGQDPYVAMGVLS